MAFQRKFSAVDAFSMSNHVNFLRSCHEGDKAMAVKVVNQVPSTDMSMYKS